MKEDPGLLHFVIEDAGLDAGHLYFGIEKTCEAGWVITIDCDVGMAAVQQDAELSSGDGSLRIRNQIGGLDDGSHGDESAVRFGADHLFEAGARGHGKRTVAQECKLGVFDVRPEAFVHGPAHPNSVAGNELVHEGGVHINRRVTVLDEQVSFVGAVVGNGGLEVDRLVLTGLIVGEARGLLRCGNRARRL